jgi:hypothetical protein
MPDKLRLEEHIQAERATEHRGRCTGRLGIAVATTITTKRICRCRWPPAAWPVASGPVRPITAGSCLVSWGTDTPSGRSTPFFPSGA